jgi:hypothetical protein
LNKPFFILKMFLFTFFVTFVEQNKVKDEQC